MMEEQSDKSLFFNDREGKPVAKGKEAPKTRQEEQKQQQQQQQHQQLQLQLQLRQQKNDASTTPFVKKSKRKLHIITDDGFLYSFVVQLLVVVGVWIACETSQVPLFISVREFVSSSYYNFNDYMLDTAYRYAWWSVIGLLSSSCCALQLILNAFSLGCAGFNTVLGPIRPTLLAITAVVQAWSWIIAYNRPWQYVPNSVSTIIVLSLAFLPEFLHFFSSSKKEFMSMNNANKAFPSNIAVLMPTETDTRNKIGSDSITNERDHENKDKNKINVNRSMNAVKTYYFRMENVGCAACVATVSRVLDGISPTIVKSYSVSLEEEMLCIQIKGEDNDATTFTSINNKHIVMAKLDEAGFPIRSLVPVEN